MARDWWSVTPPGAGQRWLGIGVPEPLTEEVLPSPPPFCKCSFQRELKFFRLIHFCKCSFQRVYLRREIPRRDAPRDSHPGRMLAFASAHSKGLRERFLDSQLGVDSGFRR